MATYDCEVEGCTEPTKGRLCPEHAALKAEWDADVREPEPVVDEETLREIDDAFGREAEARERREEDELRFQREEKRGEY